MIVRYVTIALAAVLGAACGESGPVSDDITGLRNSVVTTWDTLFIAGGLGVNDTLFARPHRLSLAGDLVLVGDGLAERIIALDRATGAVRWTFGRPGGGPTELRGIADIKAAKDGSILVLDYGNARVAKLSTEGALLGVKRLGHLPAVPSAILPLDDYVIAKSPIGTTQPFMELDPDSLELRRRFSLAWPDPIPELANTEVTLAESSERYWVSAFSQGPGFSIWRDGVAASYQYIENIYFASKVGPSIRQMGADSSRFGAVSLSVVGGEIFMLFGGRPVRSAHPGEPTVWIDVYSHSGEYLRSYRLPSDTDMMATDGRVFYLLVSDSGFPRLIALRPRDDQAQARRSACDSVLMATPTPTPTSAPPAIVDRTAALRSIERAARETGVVGGGKFSALVWFLIDRQGGVAAAQIAESSGSERADTAALISARSFHFTPGLRNGHRVCVWVRLPIVLGPSSGAS